METNSKINFFKNNDIKRENPETTGNFLNRNVEATASVSNKSPEANHGSTSIQSVPLAQKKIAYEGNNQPWGLGIFSYEHGDIKRSFFRSSKLDLSQNPYMETIKVGKVQGKLFLPPSVKTFICQSIGSKFIPDWKNCSQLTTFKIELLKIIKKKFQMPSSIKDFECHMLQSDGLVVSSENCLELSHCLKLVRVQVVNLFDVVLKLPSSLEECKIIHTYVYATLDLSECKNLTTLVMGDIFGNLLMPNSCPNLTTFQCGRTGASVAESEVDIPFTPIDLRHYPNLKTIKVTGELYRPLILSSKYHSTLAGSLPTDGIQWVD